MKHGYLSVLGVAFLLGTCCAHGQHARWVETHSWEGRGHLTTPLIHINGAKWRIVYRLEKNRALGLTVYDADGNEVAKPDKGLKAPGGWREFETGKGHVYLRLADEDMNWAITVRQYLTTIEEWELLQEIKEGLPPLHKFGVWFGSRGEDTYTFTLPEARWRLRAQNRGSGPLVVQIIDRDTPDVPLLRQTIQPDSTYETWVHRGGRFQLEATGAHAAWELAVDYRRNN